MANEQDNRKKSGGREKSALNEKDLEAIQYLKDSVADGKHWYPSLLEAIRMWASREEDFRGRHLNYLIDNEAFDWLLLAERLCTEIEGNIPEQEKIALLFFDKPPLNLSRDDFKKLIGPAKYKAYLNYTYGVLVEEALILAVVGEVRKERRSLGSNRDRGVLDEACRKIYGLDEQALLSEFVKAKRYYGRQKFSLSDLKEFNYWLFKYRLKRCEKPRIASDTRKALLYLQNAMELKGTGH